VKLVDEVKREIVMRVFLSLLLILATNFAYAKQMEITCDSTVNEYKYNQIKEYGLNIGDIWVTNKYVFDASDFSNGEGEGTAQRTKDFKFESQKTVSNVPYYVNRVSIVFGTLRHPTSINRKTLEILEEQVTPYKCRIAEVDTSENAF
jgi:hypothetical protein